jgi:WD40 repeat protein
METTVVPPSAVVQAQTKLVTPPNATDVPAAPAPAIVQPLPALVKPPLPASPSYSSVQKVGSSSAGDSQQRVGWKRVYLFVSSTFNDMHAERDYLIKRVFPGILDWCEARKIRLLDIDLRWGVTEEDATRNKNVVQVCLDRIDQCRPFFLCFLGQRYGWMPGIKDLAPHTFDNFQGVRELVEAGTSVTELEIRHAMQPFPCPELAVQPAPSERTFFYFRDPAYVEDMTSHQPQHPRLYMDAAGSIPEQRLESLKGQIQEHWPTRHYWCQWAEKESTPELVVPLQCPSALPENQERWRQLWREVAGVTVTDLDVTEDPAEAAKARAYNQRVAEGRLADFYCLQQEKALDKVIQEDLIAAIAEQYPEHREVIRESELQKEIDQHEEFVFSSSEGFIERGDDFTELDGYVDGDSRQLFALVAEAGMGKSTLLANWADRLRKRLRSNKGESIHLRFIGAGERSNSVHDLMYYLLLELRDVAHKLDAQDEIPYDPNELRQKWPELLAKVAQKGKTVLLFDALNQLDSGLADLNWLMRELPPNLKLVVSFKLVAEAGGDALCRDYERDARVRVSWVRPFESLEDRRKLVRAFLGLYLKEMDDRYLELLIQLKGAHSPLYLKVVLFELRVFGSFAQLKAKIERDFGDTPRTAFQAVLHRLESDTSYSFLEPKVAVPQIFGLLAYARRGLSVEELTEILFQARPNKNLTSLFTPTDEGEALERTRIRDTVQLFLRQVRPFLARREGRYDFFYESFLLAARERYTAEGSGVGASQRKSSQWHGMLADYFGGLPTFVGGKAGDVEAKVQRRKASELVHHQIEAGRWPDAAASLSDLELLEARFQAKLDITLFQDYAEALHRGPDVAHWPDRKGVEEFLRFVRGDAHILRRSSSETCQRAANQPDASTPAAAARARWEMGEDSRPWVRWCNKPQQLSPCLLTFVGHSEGVQACGYSPDGTHIVSASDDKTLKVWDAQTGQQLATLTGHSEGVKACGYSPDGTRIVSASWDNTLKVWDAQTGQLIATLSGSYSDGMIACEYSPDGRHIVSASGDNTLKIWNAQTYQSITTLTNFVFSGVISMCGYSPDGTLIVSTSDKALKVWNTQTGKLIITLHGHSDDVMACSFSPDSKHIVSASKDKTLKVWDVQTGQPIATFSGHSDQVITCEYSRDGTCIVSASQDKTLKVWDVQTGQPIATFSGHSVGVVACGYSPDGRRIVSASRDETLKVWDTQTGQLLVTLSGHNAAITACRYSPDGRRIVSASQDKTLKVWDAQTGQHLTTLTGHSDMVTACGFAPDDRHIVSASWDNTLKIWDAQTGQLLATLTGHSHLITACGYSPDGRLIASASVDTLKVWDAQTGQPLATLVGHPSVGGLVYGYSPDGRRIVFADGDKALKIWDAQSDQIVATLSGHSAGVVACVYSPDGMCIVSASADHTLKVWDARTYRTLASFSANGYLMALAVGYSGRIAAGDAGGSVYLIELMGIEPGTPIVTLRHVYRFDRRSWDEQPTAPCGWCGQPVTPPSSVLQAIRESSQPRMSPEASDDPRMVADCPYCQKPLRFNPFVAGGASR